MKQLWKHYLDSFVDLENAYEQNAPLPVVIIVLPFAGFIVGAGFAEEAVGLNPIWVPLAFLAAGGINSVTSYFVGIKRTNIWAAQQLLDFAFYCLTSVSAAAFSKPPAAYGFLVVLLVTQQGYARVVALSALPAITTLIPACLFALFATNDVIIWGVVLTGSTIYLFTSKATRQQLVQTRKAVRAQTVLERIDNIILQQRKRILGDKRIGLAALFHELKNEIGPAVWNVDYISSNKDDPEERGQALVDLRTSLVRSSELIQNFYILMEREEAQNRDGFALSELSEALGDLQKKSKVSDSTSIEVGVLPATRVKGAVDFLALALHNLTSNAFEAGARKVTVDSYSTDSGAAEALLIKDDGPGLPEPVKKRLFEPFNTHGKETGTGLGIYLAARLVEASDGKLSLVETGPQGTSFEVKLPILNVSSSDPQHPADVVPGKDSCDEDEKALDTAE